MDPNPLSPEQLLAEAKITIHSREVRTIQRIAGCEVCQSGELVHDGGTKDVGINKTARVDFRHRCTYCKRGCFLTEAFPQIDYEPLPMQEVALEDVAAATAPVSEDELAATNEALR